jgi:hypothetical protein
MASTSIQFRAKCCNSAIAHRVVRNGEFSDLASIQTMPDLRDLRAISRDIADAILLIRGRRVILDESLAALYGVETKALKRAVRRNLDRFPDDFMFELTARELSDLRRQIGTSNARGGLRYLPFAFSEQGVAMLSSVLRSKQAVLVNIEIMRTFVRLRAFLATNAELARKLALLESRYDRQFKVVFGAGRLSPRPRKDYSLLQLPH